MKKIAYACLYMTLIVGCSSVKPTPPPPPLPSSSAQSLAFRAAAVMPTPAFATTNVPTATLLWGAPSEPRLKGYKVYMGTASKTYTTIIDVGNVLSKQITPLVRGTTYFFAVSDYTTNTPALESDFSNEVSYTVPNIPPPPVNLSLTVDIVYGPTLQGPWKSLTNMVATISNTNNPSFFKGTLVVKSLP